MAGERSVAAADRIAIIIRQRGNGWSQKPYFLSPYLRKIYYFLIILIKHLKKPSQMSNPPPRHRNQYGSSPTTQIKQNSRPDILPGSNRKFVNDGPGSKTRSIKEANMEIDISNIAGSDAGNDQHTFKTEAGVSSISTKMKTSRSNVERTKDRGLQGDNKKNEIR